MSEQHILLSRTHPLKLLFFSKQKDSNQLMANWTAIETNTSHFQLLTSVTEVRTQCVWLD